MKKVFELPLAPGDKVYKLNPFKTKVIEWNVETVMIYANNRIGFEISYKGSHTKKNMDDVGDNVFLTQVEAEQKLKEIKEKINESKSK